MSTLTKIFVFLTLIFSLGVSVMVVTMVAHQQAYKDQVTAEVRAKIAAQAMAADNSGKYETALQTNTALQTKLADSESKRKMSSDEAISKNASLESEITQRDAKIVSLQNSLNNTTAIADATSKTNTALYEEVHRLSPENVRLVKENAELARVNNELQTANAFAEKSIRKLQEQVQILTDNAGHGGASAPSNDTGTVASLSVVTPAQINGKISVVTPTAGRTLVELPLGTRDGVRKGTRFMVYRGQTYIADAVVEKPDPDVCVAAIDPATLKAGQTVQVGDMVMTAAK